MNGYNSYLTILIDKTDKKPPTYTYRRICIRLTGSSDSQAKLIQLLSYPFVSARLGSISFDRVKQGSKETFFSFALHSCFCMFKTL